MRLDQAIACVSGMAQHPPHVGGIDLDAPRATYDERRGGHGPDLAYHQGEAVRTESRPGKKKRNVLRSVTGQEVADKISEVPRNSEDKPDTPVKILRISIRTVRASTPAKPAPATTGTTH